MALQKPRLSDRPVLLLWQLVPERDSRSFCLFLGGKAVGPAPQGVGASGCATWWMRFSLLPTCCARRSWCCLAPKPSMPLPPAWDVADAIVAVTQGAIDCVTRDELQGFFARDLLPLH